MIRNSTVELLEGSKMTLFKLVFVVMLMAVFAQDTMDKSKNSTNKGKNSFVILRGDYFYNIKIINVQY